MSYVRNVPVPCPRCRISIRGNVVTRRDTGGEVVKECTWRCQRCGMTIKKGKIK